MPVTEHTRRRWRGVEPDARQEDRRRRLLDAAFELLGTEGAAAATIRGVCAHSGLHSRYFYESFADGDALLVAVFDRLAAEAIAVATAAGDQAGSDPRDRLSAALRAIARFLTEDPRRIRVLAIEGRDHPALTRRRLHALQTIARLGEEAGYARYGPPPPGEQIGRIAAHFVTGGLAELFVAWLNRDFEGTFDQLIDDAVELIMAINDRTAAIATRRAPSGRRRR